MKKPSIKQPDLKKILATTLRYLKKYMTILIILVSIAFMSYAALQIQSIGSPEPDEATLTKGLEKIQKKKNKLKSRQETLLRIQQLRKIEVDVEPKDLGKINPFN